MSPCRLHIMYNSETLCYAIKPQNYYLKVERSIVIDYFLVNEKARLFHHLHRHHSRDECLLIGLNKS